MQGALVLHVQVHIKGPGQGSWSDVRGHLAVRMTVECDDVLLDLFEVRNFAFRQGRSAAFDVFRQEIFRPLDPQPPDLILGDLQSDDPEFHILWRHRNSDKTVTGLPVSFFQIGTCLLHMTTVAGRSHEGINGPFDINPFELGGPLDLVVPDVKRRLRRLCRNRALRRCNWRLRRHFLRPGPRQSQPDRCHAAGQNRKA